MTIQCILRYVKYYREREHQTDSEILSGRPSLTLASVSQAYISRFVHHV